eukprot:COSAG02_NODE_873_length_16302_cov_113.473616_1_plen_206_part_10
MQPGGDTPRKHNAGPILGTLAWCCFMLIGATSDEVVPTLVSTSKSLAPRLAFQREELSRRQLQRAQDEAAADGGDHTLAWRHLEASYNLDRGNVDARRQILTHHLDAALAYDSSTKDGQDWIWRVDHELDAALATVHRSSAAVNPAELEEFNDLAQQFNYRKRRRQREHAGQQRLLEVRLQQQQQQQKQLEEEDRERQQATEAPHS